MEEEKGRQDYFRTSMGGAVYGVGTEGSLTGFGAGKKRPEFGGGIVIDDPLVAMDALTVRRDTCNLWYSQTLYSRRNAAHTPILLIMQRLHERDLVGHVQASEPGQWHILNIPVVADNGLGSLFYAVFQVEFSPADVKQRFHAPCVSDSLVSVEGVPRKPHHLARLRNVAQLGSQIQKPGLVFDDVLIETLHWGISVGMVPG